MKYKQDSLCDKLQGQGPTAFPNLMRCEPAGLMKAGRGEDARSVR